jgi:hypothetical protein
MGLSFKGLTQGARHQLQAEATNGVVNANFNHRISIHKVLRHHLLDDRACLNVFCGIDSSANQCKRLRDLMVVAVG